MRNIRVAILDTGIADEIIDDRIKLKKQIYYDYFDETIVYKDTATDFNGHGTVCVNTVWSVFPKVDFYIINAMGVSGRASSRVLAEALLYAKQLDVDIVSICSSLVVGENDNTIKNICDEITASGKVIVAAVQNGKESSAIANYPNVIGVRGELIGDFRYAFSKANDVQMVCDSTNHILKGRNLLCKTFFGNSRATAIATGIVAKLMYSSIDTGKNVIDLLQENADVEIENISEILEEIRDYILDKNFDFDREQYLVENSKEYHKLIYGLCEYIACNDVDMIRKTQLWSINNNYFTENIGPFFAFLKDRFDIEIEDMKLEDIEYAYKLYDVCFKDDI